MHIYQLNLYIFHHQGEQRTALSNIEVIHKETGEVYVGKTAPEDIENWTQDEDVLDTWFSSALWPFSTLGWPNTEDPLFKRYFQQIL